MSRQKLAPFYPLRFLAAILLLLAPAWRAHAVTTDIQMLPPLEGISPALGTPNCNATGTPINPGASKVLTWDGANPIGCTPKVFVDPNSNLSVGGSIGVSDDARTCGTGTATDAPAGALRFNSLTKSFEGCDGTSWQALLGHVPELYQTSCDVWAYGAAIVCTTINTQTASQCSEYAYPGTTGGCVPPPNFLPAQPVGTYQTTCGDWAYGAAIACTTINTQTASQCSEYAYPGTTGGCVPP